ncbi:hypothetical protein D1646_13865 [Pseudoflavonifractor sp. 60]|uniref:flagellar export chaperone FlgN n=1 Tax=Pseudoflavonifractor sp. 60 TaxID=2304576 RepID=UPI00136C10F1|nr:flagellar export chaperone FlgN [Pseudoflavonifractor sp. 60]NBI67870.1 hypothetical protein [Pseudoflavonifractor sp. 60]
MTQWQDYLKLLRGLSKTLQELAQVEREKNAAASTGNLRGVEECMKREQVLSLSLRGCDQKRDKLLAQLGLTGVGLRDLERHSPEEHRLETKAVAEELRQQYEIFQTASKLARHTLEANLRAIERTQAVQAGDRAEAEELRRAHQTDFKA